MKKEISDLQYIILIKALLDSTVADWNKYRSIASKDINSKEVDDFLNKLLEKDLSRKIINSGSTVFRARQICQKNQEEIGVSKDLFYDKIFSCFVTKEDIDKYEKTGLNFTKENIFYHKLSQLEAIDTSIVEQIFIVINEMLNATFLGFGKDKCGVPPMEFRKEGRLNRVDDAFLYASLDPETAINEMRPMVGQQFSIANGMLKKDMVFANLSDYSQCSETNAMLCQLINQIAEPNTEQDVTFYHITQLVSHKIKDKGYDGILFKSSLRKEGVNALIFDEHNIEFVSSYNLEIDNVKVDKTLFSEEFENFMNTLRGIFVQ